MPLTKIGKHGFNSSHTFSYFTITGNCFFVSPPQYVHTLTTKKGNHYNIYVYSHTYHKRQACGLFAVWLQYHHHASDCARPGRMPWLSVPVCGMPHGRGSNFIWGVVLLLAPPPPSLTSLINTADNGRLRDSLLSWTLLAWALLVRSAYSPTPPPTTTRCGEDEGWRKAANEKMKQKSTLFLKQPLVNKNYFHSWTLISSITQLTRNLHTPDCVLTRIWGPPRPEDWRSWRVHFTSQRVLH